MKVRYTTMIADNMKDSVDFYENVMGFKVQEVYNLPNGSEITILDGGGAMIELIESSDFETGLYSMGVEVENLEKTLEDMRAKEVEITMEPVRTLVGIMAFIKDPNGVNIALIEHRQRL